MSQEMTLITKLPQNPKSWFYNKEGGLTLKILSGEGAFCNNAPLFSKIKKKTREYWELKLNSGGNAFIKTLRIYIRI